ncbi:MAG: hypothetical protein R3224_09630 [Balneolaceae bacterium]|nr:hypothetical protein [Balneolaceae bacterium]
MNFKFYRKLVLSLGLAAALLFIATGQAHAQMFSVQEDDASENRAIPPNNFYIGIEPVQFDYEGPAMAGSLAGLFEFDGPVIRAKYETFGLEAFIGAGGRLTGVDDVAFFDIGIRATRGLRLVSNQNFSLQIPLQIKSSLTSVTNDQVISSGSQFRQGTLTIGGGGQIGGRLSDDIRVSAGIVPNYGFSFATGGTFGGQIFELETSTRIYFDRVFGNIGISAGWDYTFKRYDIEENEFDYNFQSNGFLIGISF